MSNYKAFIAIPLGDQTIHVAFKLDRFRSPVIAEAPIDVLPLIQAEQPLLEQLQAEFTKEDPDQINPQLIAELQSQVRLPEFISSYVDSGQKSNAIFDILPKEEFEEATIEESKVDLKTQNKILQARLQELEGEKEV